MKMLTLCLLYRGDLRECVSPLRSMGGRRSPFLWVIRLD